MSYLFKTHTQKRIPGVVVVSFMMVFVVSLYLFLSNRVSQPSVTDKPGIEVERVDVANVKDTSLTIFWRTASPAKSYLEYQVEGSDNWVSAVDVRERKGILQERSNHVVDIVGLPSRVSLNYRLIVNNDVIQQAEGVPFTTSTLRKINTPLEKDPVYGDVVRSSGIAEDDAVVMLRVGSSLPLLTTTAQDGTFLFSLCCMFDMQSGDQIIPTDDDPVQINIIAEDGSEKVVQGTVSDISPLTQALIIDGTIEDFAMLGESENDEQVLAVADSIKDLEDIDIIFPKEGAFIPGTRPLVRGVGEPGKNVKGHFVQAGRFFEVRVDEQRNWVYEPGFDLDPGQHELTVQTQDERNKAVEFTRAFTILKSGEAVLAESTPSGTITPSASPSPTEVITPATTATPTASLTLTPTPPVSGLSLLPVTAVSLILIVIGVGIILLF